MHAKLLCLTLLGWPALGAGGADPPERLPAPPGLEADYHLRGGLENCRLRFERDKVGLVTFLGGSITQGGGWRDLFGAELRRRFPDCRFTFVNAGISSVDSSGHAFRFARDVLGHGVPDLLFVEAAVNDLHNERTPLEQRLAMEGIIRAARLAGPRTDVVFLHFADVRHIQTYARGQTPEIVTNHEAIAAHYGVPSLNLIHEIHLRIAAGQMDWARDFRDCHPSPWGHQLYLAALQRFCDQAWARPAAADARQTEFALPEPLDARCYQRGHLLPPGEATALAGFRLVERWRPSDRAGTRGEFVNVPALVGETPGASLSLAFSGTAIGAFITAGPDAGLVEFRVDGGDWQRRDTFTQWSGGLHLPWVLLLRNDLSAGPHRLELRLCAEHHPHAKGTALRVQQWLVNG